MLTHPMPLKRIVSVTVALLAWLAADGHAFGQWISSFAAPGPDERVHALIMHDDGSGPAMYAGGVFRAIDGQLYNGIARYRDGQWSGLAGGVQPPVWGGPVRALAVFNGELIAGGSFSNIGGVPVSNIARWDGREWHAMGDGLRADALMVHNGELIAAGSRLGGQSSSVQRWDGATWQPVGSISQETVTLVAFRGELIAGGGLASLGNVVRWTGSKWEPVGGGVNASVKRVGDLRR